MANALFDVDTSSAGSLDVLDCTAEQINIVGETADGCVASSTKCSTDDSGLVVVVDMELLWSLTTDGADTSLALDHLVVLDQCEPVETLQGVLPAGVRVRLPEPSGGTRRGAPLGLGSHVGDVLPAVQARVSGAALADRCAPVLSLSGALAFSAPSARDTLTRGEGFEFEETIAPTALEHVCNPITGE